MWKSLSQGKQQGGCCSNWTRKTNIRTRVGAVAMEGGRHTFDIGLKGVKAELHR